MLPASAARFCRRRGASAAGVLGTAAKSGAAGEGDGRPVGAKASGATAGPAAAGTAGVTSKVDCGDALVIDNAAGGGATVVEGTTGARSGGLAESADEAGAAGVKSGAVDASTEEGAPGASSAGPPVASDDAGETGVKSGDVDALTVDGGAGASSGWVSGSRPSDFGMTVGFFTSAGGVGASMMRTPREMPASPPSWLNATPHAAR